MPFNFILLTTGLDSELIRKAILDLEGVLPGGAWPNWVFGNHDEPRIATRLGHVESRTAALLLLTLRGTPTVYYGDELGMPEARIPQELVKDPWGLRVPGFSRDGCRTPMQWTPGTQAGFSTNPETWLPVQAHHSINVETELADPNSHLNLYRRLLSVRRAESALQVGDMDLLEGLPSNCLGYRRTAPSARPITVCLNLSPVAVRCSWNGEVLVSTHPAPHQPGRLRPWEGVILVDS